MAIIRRINFSEFCDAFRDYDRNDQFSYEGKKALFDYLEEYSESTGENVELDIVALCCEYYESSTTEIADNYNLTLAEGEAEALDDDEKDEMLGEIVREYLEENTVIVGYFRGSFVYGAF